MNDEHQGLRGRLTVHKPVRFGGYSLPMTGIYDEAFGKIEPIEAIIGDDGRVRFTLPDDDQLGPYRSTMLADLIAMRDKASRLNGMKMNQVTCPPAMAGRLHRAGIIRYSFEVAPAAARAAGIPAPAPKNWYVDHAFRDALSTLGAGVSQENS